ncbi:MAG: NCS2 family permease [Planctomycetota bacterium]|nr:NCS2 family permease [Planctomycetota bacterium]
MPWFVRGDIDGFFGLALDNFVQLLLIANLCRFVLGFPSDLLYGRVLPGAAVSILLGNLFYSWQARQLSRATGRRDICALPYGINTPSLIAYVFLVMLPVKLAALNDGKSAEVAAHMAWQAGLVACVGSAVIESSGAFIAERIRKSSPRAALLSTLAGIALGFISLGFLRTFAHPVVGLTTLAVVMLIYFGHVRFKGGLPGGLVAVLLGTALAWLTGIAPVGDSSQLPGVHFHPPVPVIGDLLEALRSRYLIEYLSVIVPMGLFNVVGSLQNIESAEAAGDLYPTRPSLLANGIGSLSAALFGSCFPTTIYIGHPGWKAMGARAGYSILNGTFVTILCLSGALAYVAWAVPIDAGMAIVLWIGIVISAQAFQAVPREHAPAVVLGILPGVAAWGALMLKEGLRVGGYGSADRPFGDPLIGLFEQRDMWAQGIFSLEQGFIFTAMVLAASTVYVIERRFHIAALWCAIGAALSACGLMHSYAWTQADTAISLSPAWPFVIGYAVMALVFLVARWVTVAGEGHC